MDGRFHLPGIWAGMVVALAIGACGEEFRTVVAGDTLCEEYAFMTASGGPYGRYGFASPESEPAEANTMNWVEILGRQRGGGSGADSLFLGVYALNWYVNPYDDLRRAGYSMNFGFPGYKTTSWVNLLNAKDEEGDILWHTKKHLASALITADVVVVMMGWEDLKQNYGRIFDDTWPAGNYGLIVDRLIARARYFDGALRTRPVVICTVPDPGVSPAMMADHPDPGMRADARARIRAMNDELKVRATAEGFGIADVHAVTLRVEDEVPLVINGQEFLAAGHPENLPEYLFCGDELHPATVLQCLFANEVIGGINALLGTSIEPFSNRELLEVVPGLDPDSPYLEWIAGQGVALDGMHDNPDKDPFDNLAEFSFGLDPGDPDPGLTHEWSGAGGGRLGIVWSLAPEAAGYVVVGAEQSVNLADWTPLAAEAIENLGGGNWRASIDSSDPAGFLRVTVSLAP